MTNSHFRQFYNCFPIKGLIAKLSFVKYQKCLDPIINIHHLHNEIMEVNIFKIYFYFYLFTVCVLVCVYMCDTCVRCLWKLEDGARCTEAELQNVVSCVI